MQIANSGSVEKMNYGLVILRRSRRIAQHRFFPACQMAGRAALRMTGITLFLLHPLTRLSFVSSVLAADDTLSSWYDSESTEEADKTLFHDKADKEFAELTQHLERLKAGAEKDPSRVKDPQVFSKIEKKMKTTEREFKILKSAEGDYGNKIRGKFQASLDEINGLMEEKSAEILPEEEHFEWKTKSRLEDLQYQIDQLRKAEFNPEWGNKDELDKKILDLEKSVKDRKEELKTMQGSSKAEWKEKKEELDKTLKDINAEYQDIHRRVRQAKDPVIKTFR